MMTRLILAASAALACSTMAMAQAPLSNGNLDALDTDWFTPRPAGYRLYNSTQYRRTDDGGIPAAVTRNGSLGSVLLPGALGAPSAQFTAVHSEEFRVPGVPLSGRNWPEYTFDPANGVPITISCWFNIPATDPVVGGRFGIKVCFLRSGLNFSCYQEVEWLDIDPLATTPPPGTVIVQNVEPPVGSGLTAGPGIHTNGQWVKFERVFNQSQFGAFPTPPTNPARASVFAQRFSVDTNSFGSVWVDDIEFKQVAPCRQDFNGNGSTDVPDIFAFLAAWFAGDLRADFNNNGSTDVPDIFAFLAAWFAGC